MNDIQLSESLDLLFFSGDFSTGEGNRQHEELLLLLQKGSLKIKPLVGVGVQDYLNNADIDTMLLEMRHQFIQDGMQIKNISWDDVTTELKYDATYNS